MYGDTEVVRGLARAVRRTGEEVRAEADLLLARARHVPWSGWAAAAMRLRVEAQVQALRRTAALHDAAAQALERHADEVDRRKAMIAAAEAWVVDTAEAVADEAEGLLDHLGQLGHLVHPPSGHRDWLDLVPMGVL